MSLTRDDINSDILNGYSLVRIGLAVSLISLIFFYPGAIAVGVPAYYFYSNN